MKKSLVKYTVLFCWLCFCWSCHSGKQEFFEKMPSDKDATIATTALYSNLNLWLEKGIMLGHQDDLAYGNKWYKEAGRSDVKSVCGDYPAVFGWNLGNIETGSPLNDDSVAFSDIRTYISDVEKLGGISTLNWNVHNPFTGKSGNDCSVEGAVSSVINDKTIQKRYFKYLDRLALFLNSLKDEEGNLIPVIVQLFQENNIPEKYWWNTQQCSSDDFRKLWMLTINYLRDEKNIHHVLYLFSFSADNENNSLVSYYPGNNYVDMIGVSQQFVQENDPIGEIYMRMLNKNLKAITQFAEKNNKIATLTNTGMEGIKIPNYFSKYVYPVISQYKLSYIMFGRNSWNDENKYYIPVPGHPASDDFNVFSKSPRILTCSKISE